MHLFFSQMLLIKKYIWKKNFFFHGIYTNVSFLLISFHSIKHEENIHTTPFNFHHVLVESKTPETPRYHLSCIKVFKWKKKKKKSVAYCRAISLIYALDIRLPDMAPFLFSLWYKSPLCKFLCIIQGSLLHLTAWNDSRRPTLEEAKTTMYFVFKFHTKVKAYIANHFHEGNRFSCWLDNLDLDTMESTHHTCLEKYTSQVFATRGSASNYCPTNSSRGYNMPWIQ